MNIGFDAKRAYENNTGLGHYSRTLLKSLASLYANHKFFLFAPKLTRRFDSNQFSNIFSITPQKFPFKLFRNYWRSKGVVNDLKANAIDIYHGLSHQIPKGLKAAGIKSVVTIHDVIYERYPEQFSKIDNYIFRKKFTYACNNADRIIAISEQTKADIVYYYKIAEHKISVCYQSCDEIFRQKITDQQKLKVQKQYNLPKQFFLSVGSVIERKNLLKVVEALTMLPKHLQIPLVVIGSGKGYKKKVQKFVAENNLQKQVIFLNDNPTIMSIPEFASSADFPSIYQLATALIYPSSFEGFGIPVLEALCSGVPVITSNVSCLPEAGGDAAYYVSPTSAQEIAIGMKRILENKDFVITMIEKGYKHAENFSLQKTSAAVMKVYQSL